MSSREDKDWMKDLLLERRRINFGTATEEITHPRVAALRWYQLPKNIKVRGDAGYSQKSVRISMGWDATFTAVTDSSSNEWDELVKALEEFDEIAVDMEAHTDEAYHSSCLGPDSASICHRVCSRGKG